MLQPLAYPPVPNAIIMPCLEDILAPSGLYILCYLQHPFSLVPEWGWTIFPLPFDALRVRCRLKVF